MRPSRPRLQNAPGLSRLTIKDGNLWQPLDIRSSRRLKSSQVAASGRLATSSCSNAPPSSMSANPTFLLTFLLNVLLNSSLHTADSHICILLADHAMATSAQAYLHHSHRTVERAVSFHQWKTSIRFLFSFTSMLERIKTVSSRIAPRTGCLPYSVITPFPETGTGGDAPERARPRERARPQRALRAPRPHRGAHHRIRRLTRCRRRHPLPPTAHISSQKSTPSHTASVGAGALP